MKLPLLKYLMIAYLFLIFLCRTIVKRLIFQRVVGCSSSSSFTIVVGETREEQEENKRKTIPTPFSRSPLSTATLLGLLYSTGKIADATDFLLVAAPKCVLIGCKIFSVNPSLLIGSQKCPSLEIHAYHLILNVVFGF